MQEPVKPTPPASFGSDVELRLTALKFCSLVYLRNGRSVLWDIVVNSARSFGNVTVSITYSPDYVETCTLEGVSLEGGKPMTFRLPAAPRFDEGRLLAVEEEEPGKVCVSITTADGELLARAESEFVWLPHNAWAGGFEFPELLAALTLPEDAGVDTLLCDTQKQLADAGKSAEWCGYKGSAEETAGQLRALWDTLAGYGIRYALPPKSWLDDGVGQRVRTPSQILQRGCSTCLDSTLLLAAAVSRMGLNPVVILISGHAFLGVWLKPAALPSPKVLQVATVRNVVKQGQMLLLETTAVNGEAGDAPAPFERAAATAETEIERLTDDDFFMALDLRLLWHECSIRPILGGTGSQYVAAAADAEELVTTRPQSRMDTWQLKLLDLSLRNNLLNCNPDGKRQLGLLLPDVGALEDELAKGTAFRIRSLPQTFWTALSAYYKGAESGDEHRRVAECVDSMFRKRELTTALNETDLQRCLQGIYGTARREMEESGANTLYLACGFLKWYRKGVGDKPYYAPLLLLPVTLSRPSIKAGFSLRGADEEPRVNLTLLEYLRTEYELQIPELEGELPTDEFGLDIPLIFNIVRKAISAQAGWEVDERCTLGSFSFTKYLMWKDLTERRENLLKNPIVAQIAAEQRSTFPDQGGFPDPKTLDNEVEAEKVFTPLSADSSQLSAVLAAARGKSFVLIGPPGTGKSQTIANMIAHCLGHGKTVLFVAEKSAALEVVHKRLKRIGLDDFCLELHSHKANKKEALAQFQAAVNRVNKGAAPDQWNEAVYSMANLRYRLNLLPWEIHKHFPDGGTLYGDVGMLAQHPGSEYPVLVQDAPLTLTPERRAELLETARELARHFRMAERVPADVRSSFRCTECSAAAEAELAETLQRYAELSRRLAAAADALTDCLASAASREQVGRLCPVLAVRMQRQTAIPFAFAPQRAAQSMQRLQELAAHAERCRTLRAKFSLPYPDSALADPMLDSWLRECRELCVSGFFTRWFGMRRLARTLKGLALSARKPDCLNDLTALVSLRDELKALREAEPAADLPPDFCRGEATCAADVERAAEWVKLMRALTPADEKTLEMLEADAKLLPSPQHAVGQAVQTMSDLAAQVTEQRKRLETLLGAPLADDTAAADGQGSRWAAALAEYRESWHELALWNRMAEIARSKGCAAVVDALASGAVAPDDAETAVAVSIARSRVPAAVDASEVLSHFAPQVHEARMAEFAEKDSALLRKTSEHIRTLLTARAAKISSFGQETSLLQRELSKQRAHMPLRQLLSALPNVAPLLKPCLLMSPLSVAQYLTTETAPFDVVIFDEASQIPVWDAIGVIARGKSAVIVGDPRQMPPTSFFSRSKGAGEDEYSAVEADMESILDECRACGIPEMNLAWHYRSKSESLIAFSNTKYYGDKLVTFPAPVMQDTALTYHHTGGVYESGAGKRVNREEARQLVAHVVASLKAAGFRYTEATSIGIVTFNSQQQALIEEMLDAERAKDDALEPYFAEDNPEAVFVKNLENVQGDERGVIYFSTTYGRDAQGKISMNFGPLNLSGGERRLNVAVTRARYAMHVFTSMLPEDINLSRTNARGAADLHDFLDYARRGAAAYFSAHAGAAAHEAIAAAVAAQLREKGWKCRTSVGVSGYRIDLAVEHPENEGETLAGIMLDGEAYAASATARDRDVLRPAVLSGLGWRLIHLWSVDWWRHPKMVAERIDKQLRAFMEMGPPTPPQLPELVGAAPAAPAAPAPAAPQRSAASAPLLAAAYGEFRPAHMLPPLFEMNDATLCRLLCDFVQAEGPVTETRLLSGLGDICPGGMRPGVRRRLGELITELAGQGALVNAPEPAADGSLRRVLSLPSQPASQPRSKGPRDWSEIPNAEWRAGADAVRAHLGCLPGCDDHLKGTATYFGISRLTKPIRDHIAALLAP